jgi:hypothetical protein
MGCSNSSAHYDGCGPDVGQVPLRAKPVTIGETLDRRIEVARKNVEDLCITKAKLEALNVLDHPVDLYQNVVF